MMITLTRMIYKILQNENFKFRNGIEFYKFIKKLKDKGNYKNILKNIYFNNDEEFIYSPELDVVLLELIYYKYIYFDGKYFKVK